MQFVELDSEAFRNFALKSPYKSFYQTPEIAELRKQNGWTSYYFGVRKNSDLIAASMVVAKPSFLGKSTFYVPGGPLLDLEDSELTSFFFRNLQKYARSHNGCLIHVEPYYELIARDRDGEPLKNGFDHQKAKTNLLDAGLTPCTTSDEPQYSFVLELKNRTSDQLLSDMKRNTRNHIRKAEKKGVKVRELSRDELPIFKQITQSTSERRNFTDKPLKYYENMYDLFHDQNQIKYMVAEGPVDTIVKNGTEKETSLAPLSVAMFMLYGDEVIYLFSGSDEKYMKDYNAQYAIQWHMIKYAAEHDFKRYNFYGINGLPDKNRKDYGIYDFKKGFTSEETGRVTELIGAHEMPVSTFFYRLHNLLKKLKR